MAGALRELMQEEEDPTCPYFLTLDSAATAYHPGSFHIFHETHTQNSAPPEIKNLAPL